MQTLTKFTKALPEVSGIVILTFYFIIESKEVVRFLSTMQQYAGAVIQMIF